MSGFYIPNLDEVREPSPVEDVFYEVEIVDAVFNGEEGKERINVQVAILNPPEDNPNPPFIRPALFMPPEEGAEEWRISSSKLAMARFFALFGIDAPDHALDEDETQDWLATWTGKRAKCKVRKVLNKRMDRFENNLAVPALSRSNTPAGGSAPAAGSPPMV